MINELIFLVCFRWTPVFGALALFGALVFLNAKPRISAEPYVFSSPIYCATFRPPPGARTITRRGWPWCFQEYSRVGQVLQDGRIEDITVDLPKGWASISPLPLLADASIGVVLLVLAGVGLSSRKSGGPERR